MAPPTWTSEPFQQCGGQFPTQFVCARGATCIPLASDYSAALCCPAGQSCDMISPISCDTQPWNFTTTRQSSVHSLGAVSLTTCGDLCCPLSYVCDGSNTCKRSSGQIAVASGSTQEGHHTTRATGVSTKTMSPSAPSTTFTALASPSTSAGSSSSSDHSSDSLNMTAKALISVLAALLLCILIVLTWRCITRRQMRSRQVEMPSQSTHHISMYKYSKAELEGIAKRPQASVQELNAVRTPGELSPAGSVYHGRYAPHHLRLPKEVPTAYFPRPQSINSEKRELDAWSLNGWRSPPKFEWD